MDFSNAEVFHLTLEEIPVLLKKPDGSDWKCVVREMNGFSRDLYLNSERPKLASVKTGDLKDFKDVQATLISKCLFDTTTNEPVELKDIREFPSKVQHKLYQLCLKVNGFDTESEEELKKD